MAQWLYVNRRNGVDADTILFVENSCAVDLIAMAGGLTLRRSMMRYNIRDRNILFLSRDNDCLSFIAEAIAKQLLPPKTQVFSAGLKGGRIDPKAVQVLREIGINVTGQEAKRLDVIPTQDIDLIVMLGEADGTQPTVSSRAKYTTWDVSDPCREPTPDLDAFRHARDEINNNVGGLFLDYWRNLA